MAVLESVAPVAFVLVAIAPYVHSLAVSSAFLPLADVVLAFDASPDSISAFEAFFPLAIENKEEVYPS